MMFRLLIVCFSIACWYAAPARAFTFSPFLAAARTAYLRNNYSRAIEILEKNKSLLQNKEKYLLAVCYKKTGNYAGARVLMQVMPGTGRAIQETLQCGIFELTRLYTKYTPVYKETLHIIAATTIAYNAGPHREKQWRKLFFPGDMGEPELAYCIEFIPFAETRNYAKKVIRSYLLYNMLYSKDRQKL